MAQFDNAIWELNSEDFLGYTGNAPVNEAEYNARKDAMFSKDAPTWSDIQAKINLLNVHDARKAKYPEIGDQLDMLWHSIDQDAALKQKYFAFHQAILAIKSKHPK